MKSTNTRSQAFSERAHKTMIEGANAPSRGPRSFSPFPPYIKRGEGSRLFDLDGNSYIDLSMGYGCNPLGHAHPAITQAIVDTASSGVHFGSAFPQEVELAEEILSACPVEAIRLCASGTEACMAAVRLARAHTGRMKVVKFEGNFHGWADTVMVSSTEWNSGRLGTPNRPISNVECVGIPGIALDETLIVPWNDSAAVEDVMRLRGSEIACIIAEPIMSNLGVILPEPSFLQRLQELCHSSGSLFILDETVTGFRMAAGGYAALTGLEPDLITYGKALGQGFPVAALGGKLSVMNELKVGKILNGTYNACRLPIVAALAGMRELRKNGDNGYKLLNLNGERIRSEISGVLSSQKKHAAIVQGDGAIFQIMFTEHEVISNYREYCENVDEEKFSRFANVCRNFGLYINPTNSLKQNVSTMHGKEDSLAIADSISKAIDALD